MVLEWSLIENVKVKKERMEIAGVRDELVQTLRSKTINP